MEMIFIFDLIFLLCIGMTIGILLEKERREVYKHAFHILRYILIYSIPVATIIVLIFSTLYYVESSSSSFDNCILISTKAFFSLMDSDNYHINGISKSGTLVENLVCGIFSVTLIGILLDKISEDEKDRRWEPIKNEAYKELVRESENLKTNLAIMLFGFVPNQDPNQHKKIDDIFDENIESSNKDNINYSNISSRILNGSWDKILESGYNKFSTFQIKYQNYIEPKITTNVIEIQIFLSNAAQDIRICKNNNVPQQFKKEIVRELVNNVLFAAKLSKNIIKCVHIEDSSEQD
ncbi:hypothetical protein [Methanosarcina barkeri]|nr:hypothetical protein [Methanosarcina barkeri]